jgi:1-acyl-sn-glycerol-3-phosphate acyltransferase
MSDTEEQQSVKQEVAAEPGDILRGALPLAYITLNLAIWILPLLLLALLKLAIPITVIKQGLYKVMIGFYFLAVKIDLFLFQSILGIRFEVDPLDDLQKNKNYLIVSNHQSWSDILVLQSILIDHTPIIKFIVKKEILYLPLVGLICWAYEYPLVHRSSNKTKITENKNLSRDLQVLGDKLVNMGKNPAAIINFAEGSRFTEARRQKYKSPHEHLLKSRTGGLYFILNTFGQKIDYLLDFTLVYDVSEPIFFKFLGRRCRSVKVRVNKFSMPELLQSLKGEADDLDFEKVDTWLKSLWAGKDRIIDRIQKVR